MVVTISLKKVLIFFAIIVFISFLILAIYNGIISGKVIETEISGWTGEITYKERFDFGLFLIELIKWISYGFACSGILLMLAYGPIKGSIKAKKHKNKQSKVATQHKFQAGDEITYHGITNIIYSEGVIQPEDSFKIIEIGEYGTNKITRLSDGMIFSNVRLSIFVLRKANTDSSAENNELAIETTNNSNENKKCEKE